MRYRIPADPRRNAVRTRAQSTLFRRAIPRTMSRTRRALLLRNPLAMPRTIRSTSAAQSVRNVEHNSQHCRAQPAALLLRSLCAMRRTVRRSSIVQSVRNAAHDLQLFRRAVCVQCRAQPAAQCSPSSRTIGCRCNLPPTPCCRNRH